MVTRDKLSTLFDRPLRQASIDLGISPTALKSLCRKLQVPLPPEITASDSTLLKRRPETAVSVRVTLGRRIKNSAHVSA